MGRGNLHPAYMEDLEERCSGSIKGIDGEWHVQAVTIDVAAGEIATMNVRLIRTGESEEDLRRRNVEHALQSESDDVKQAVEALFQLEQELPPDQEAVVEVQVTDDKPRFLVSTRERSSNA